MEYTLPVPDVLCKKIYDYVSDLYYIEHIHNFKKSLDTIKMKNNTVKNNTGLYIGSDLSLNSLSITDNYVNLSSANREFEIPHTRYAINPTNNTLYALKAGTGGDVKGRDFYTRQSVMVHHDRKQYRNRKHRRQHMDNLNFFNVKYHENAINLYNSHMIVFKK